MSEDHSDAWLCTPAQAQALPTQIGSSACGPTAVLNVLQLLELSHGPIPDMPNCSVPMGNPKISLGPQGRSGHSSDGAAAVVDGSQQPDAAPTDTVLASSLHDTDFSTLKALVPARLRDYDAPLMGYLRSRALAGTTHLDLIHGIERVSNGAATGAFFSINSLGMTGRRFASVLRGWLVAGAVPIVTMNLFLTGQDAWHHQVRTTGLDN